MDDLADRIVEALEDLTGLATIVLFGSRARGAARPDSDLDVALLTQGLDERGRWDVRRAAAARLAGLTPSGRADIVMFEEAPELLRHRILRDGIVLMNRDPRLWNEWKVRTLREHGDREWVRALFAESLRMRLAAGGDDGRS